MSSRSRSNKNNKNNNNNNNDYNNFRTIAKNKLKQCFTDYKNIIESNKNIIESNKNIIENNNNIIENNNNIIESNNNIIESNNNNEFQSKTEYKDNNNANNNFYELLTDDNITSLVDVIENSCYTLTTQILQSDNINNKFINKYTIYFRKIIYNLDVNSEVGTNTLMTFVLDKLFNNDIQSLSFIANMPSDNMSPSSLEEERKNVYNRLNIKVEQKASKFRRCVKCKNKTVVYTIHQYRASDEPSGLSCKCIDPICGHEWSTSS